MINQDPEMLAKGRNEAHKRARRNNRRAGANRRLAERYSDKVVKNPRMNFLLKRETRKQPAKMRPLDEIKEYVKTVIADSNIPSEE